MDTFKTLTLTLMVSRSAVQTHKLVVFRLRFTRNFNVVVYTSLNQEYLSLCTHTIKDFEWVHEPHILTASIQWTLLKGQKRFLLNQSRASNFCELFCLKFGFNDDVRSSLLHNLSGQSNQFLQFGDDLNGFQKNI